VGLFLLSPLVAEYLLGDLPITALGPLAVYAPLYGGGALLIREVTRRSGRGWPTMLALGVAFGLVEEGVTTMSLFNPNYFGAHLLDNGFIPQLGIALPWTLGVLTLHAVWSIGVPIALVEELAETRRTTPWLNRTGLGCVAVVFVLGVMANTALSIILYHFVASVWQYAMVAVLASLIVFVAMRLPQMATHTPVGRGAPNPWRVGAAAFVMSGVARWLPQNWSAAALVLAILALNLGVFGMVWYWSRSAQWAAPHRLALAGGALLTNAWTGFPHTPVFPVSESVDLIGNSVFALGAVVLLCVIAVRLRGSTRDSAAPRALALDAS
jgi:hypothetical protein